MDNDKRVSVVLICLLAIISLGYIGMRYVIPWISDDNIVEEMVETAIEKSTGIDIDLSPNSQEKNENKEQ